MPEAQSITEAILRRLGGFAQNVGGQIQTNQDINRELARKAGIEQRDFDAQQLQRSIQNRLAQEGPEPERFKTIAAFEADLAQRAFDEGGIEGFFDFKRQSGEAGRRSLKSTTPKAPTITGLQRKRLIDERVGEQEEDILGRAGATDIQQLRNLSREGLARTKDAPGLFTGDIPDPDLTFSDLLQELLQGKSTAGRQAINDSIQRGLLNPELGIADQGPTAQQQDPDSIGRATYEDWDQMTEAQRAELIRLGFPTE